jgi:hypothetical protein
VPGSIGLAEAAKVETLDDFAAFVRRLLTVESDTWANPKTAGFLDGLAAFIEDSSVEDGPVPPPSASLGSVIVHAEPSWSVFAMLLVAGLDYERFGSSPSLSTALTFVRCVAWCRRARRERAGVRGFICPC